MTQYSKHSYLDADLAIVSKNVNNCRQMRYTQDRMWLPRILLPAVTLTTLFATPVFAHLEGQTYEHTVGDDMIEIGVDAVDILPGIPTAFSFALIEHPKQPGWSYVQSDDARVEIRNDAGETVHEAIIATNVSPQFLSYAFPKGGVYEVDVRYEREGLTIAETSLTMVASRNLMIDFIDWIALLALATGAYVGLLYGMTTKRS